MSHDQDIELMSRVVKFILVEFNTLIFFHKQGDRVLLFSQFTMMLDVIEIYMKDKGYAFIRLDGQTPVAERSVLRSN